MSPPPDATPIGDIDRALVNEHHTGIVTDRTTLASSLSMQVLLPRAPWHGRLQLTFGIGPNGATAYSTDSNAPSSVALEVNGGTRRLKVSRRVPTAMHFRVSEAGEIRGPGRT